MNHETHFSLIAIPFLLVALCLVVGCGKKKLKPLNNYVEPVEVEKEAVKQKISPLVQEAEPKEVFVPYKAPIKAVVYFGFNCSELSPASKEVLRNLAIDITGRKDFPPLAVTGHACPIGPDEYNQLLSEERAGEVQKLLKGFYGGVIMKSGMGERSLVELNKNRYYLNRRVEIEEASGF